MPITVSAVLTILDILNLVDRRRLSFNTRRYLSSLISPASNSLRAKPAI